MTPIVLALSQLLVLVLLLVSALVGWTREGSVAVHMYLGVGTALLALLAHTFTLFFFIGTSKAIRLACQGQAAAQPFVAESNRYKRILAGRTQLASLVFILEPVLGAAVYSSRISWLWHHAGFWLALGVQIWVGYTELKLLGLNNVLLLRVSEWKASGGLLPVDARLLESQAE
jgi:hypothetical protein